MDNAKRNIIVTIIAAVVFVALVLVPAFGRTLAPEGGRPVHETGTNYIGSYKSFASADVRVATATISNQPTRLDQLWGSTNGLVTSAGIADIFALSNNLFGGTNWFTNVTFVLDGTTASNPVTMFQLWGATNGLLVASDTNGFVTATVTNGLLGASATNGFVTAAVTNGLATTNYANALTNGYEKANLTNGLATIAYVDSATNGLTGGGAAALTNAPNVFTPASTNWFGVMWVPDGGESSQAVNYAQLVGATNSLGGADMSWTNGAATTSTEGGAIFTNGLLMAYTPTIYSGGDTGLMTDAAWSANPSNTVLQGQITTAQSTGNANAASIAVLETGKLDRAGTLAMTGNLNMGGNELTNAAAITLGGDRRTAWPSGSVFTGWVIETNNANQVSQISPLVVTASFVNATVEGWTNSQSWVVRQEDGGDTTYTNTSDPDLLLNAHWMGMPVEDLGYQFQLSTNAGSDYIFAVNNTGSNETDYSFSSGSAASARAYFDANPGLYRPPVAPVTFTQGWNWDLALSNFATRVTITPSTSGGTIGIESNGVSVNTEATAINFASVGFAVVSNASGSVTVSNTAGGGTKFIPIVHAVPAVAGSYGNTAWTAVTNWTERIDVNNTFNSATGAFTPAAGTTNTVNWNVNFSTSADGKQVIAVIYTNTPSVNTIVKLLPRAYMPSVGAAAAGGSTILYGDGSTVYIIGCYQDSGSAAGLTLAGDATELIIYANQ